MRAVSEVSRYLKVVSDSEKQTVVLDIHNYSTGHMFVFLLYLFVLYKRITTIEWSVLSLCEFYSSNAFLECFLDVVAAYKGLAKEKEALEISLKALNKTELPAEGQSEYLSLSGEIFKICLL